MNQSVRPSPSRWVTLLLVAVLAAATGAVVAEVMRRDIAVPAVGPNPELPRQLAALADRVTAVERSLAERLPLQAAAGSDGESGRVAVHDPILTELSARLTRLEQQVASRQNREQRTAAVDAQAPQPQAPPDPAELLRQTAGFQTTILDPRATEQDKLRAWGSLRNREGAWTDAVVAEMTRIGLSSADPAVRADVWRQADGRSTHPAMAVALLQALQSDAVAGVREEAAETLENYADRPDVQQALRLAREHDPDEKVRRYAQRSLERSTVGR